MSDRMTIRFGRLTSVFPYDEDNEPLNRLHARMARLCVLHEDMRLEISAIYNWRDAGE